VTAIDQAQALKIEGIARSSTRLTDEQRDAFLAAVVALAPGTWFSINDIRDQLDAGQVPPGSRAHLFYAATKAGLIDPVRTEVFGNLIPYRVRSTGTSAHLAWVNVYERMGDPT
jgi:hypothetical protein